MDKNRYFDLMRETAGFVYPLVDDCINDFQYENAALHSSVRYIVDKRDAHLLLRPFLVRLTYELCGGADWKKTTPVGAAFELLNISSYQANSAFDNKHGVLSPEQKDTQFIASMLTREMSIGVLSTATIDFAEETIDILKQDLSICNKNIYVAQHYDLNVLIMPNLKLYRDEATYLDDYTRRCYLGCGIFTGLCARAGGVLANGDQGSLEALLEFGEQFGIALQIVNDLADFVPPGLGSGRGFQDRFSDLRNGRLTLGCYRLIKRGVLGNKILSRIQSGTGFDERTCRDVAEILTREGIVSEIVERATVHGLAAENALTRFADCSAKDSLIQMLTVCHTNKFTKALDREFGEVNTWI